MRRAFFWVFHSGLSAPLMWMWGRLLAQPYPILRHIYPALTAALRWFHGGHSLQACQKVVRQLSHHKIHSTLDYCAEGMSEDMSEYETHLKELMASVASAGAFGETLPESRNHGEGRDRIPFVVFKVSALCPANVLQEASKPGGLIASGLKRKQWLRLKQDLRSLCHRGRERDVGILIDAEESWIQPAIDSLAEELMIEFNQPAPASINHGNTVVYHTVQMYRRDRLEYLKALHNRFRDSDRILGIKLVRGAYLEKETQRAKRLGYSTPLHPSKESTDSAFNQALSFCLHHRKSVSLYLATHNEHSIELSMELLRCASSSHGSASLPSQPEHLGVRRVWYAQLMGMGDHISYRLARQGYLTTKYIPYGPPAAMAPYLLRRAQENSSVQGHGEREYEVLKEECLRRKESRTVDKEPQ